MPNDMTEQEIAWIEHMTRTKKDKTKKLSQEFSAYVDKSGDGIDKGTVHENWVLEKLGEIHAIIFNLKEEIDGLRRDIAEKRR